jgi:uncharacterized protein YndB with AHSA1/START domain
MNSSKFQYVTYIRATPQPVWDALTLPEITPKYWMGVVHETDWQPGSPWKLKFADGRLADSGSVESFDAPRKLVLRWQHQMDPALTAEGVSRCEIQLEPMGDLTKLTKLTKLSVTHTMDVAESKFIAAVSFGWPMILSSLKSLLETGQPLAMPTNPSRAK